MKKIKTNLAREIIKRPDLIKFLNSNKPLHLLFEFPYELAPERVQLYKSHYFGVGQTGYYRTVLPNNNHLYIKMEYTNAMGNTHYSRFWLVYLFLCEALGIIKPETSKILEVTSGSSGIALALASEVLGYSTTILVPDNLPESRVLPMKRKGIEVIRIKGYIKECVEELRQILKNDENYFPTNHSEEKVGIITLVFKRIADEIIYNKIKLDYSILAIGNGTSTFAIGKRLKESYPNIIVIGFKPNFELEPNQYIFGLTIPNLEFRHLNDAYHQLDEVKYTNGIDLHNTQIFHNLDTEIRNFGHTSLYGVHLAYELAEKVSNKNILTIGYDKIDRY